MRIWTNRIEMLVNTLNSYGIQQTKNLQFIDEFPVVSEALTPNIIKGIRHYSEVIKCIKQEFG